MSRCRVGLILIILLMKAIPVHAAQEIPQSFALDGRLYADASAGSPLIGTGTLKIQIVDSAGTCILYEETQGYDTTLTDGAFNIQVGETNSAPTKRSGGDSGYTLADVFLNDGSLVGGKLTTNGNPCSVSAAPGVLRYVRITVTPTSGSPRVLSPNLPLSSIPSALIAENAQALSGKTASQFVNVNTTAPAVLSQSNLENIFSSTNYTKLTDLLSGNSSAYVKATANSSLQIPSSGSTPSAPQPGQIWYEGGILKFWNGSSPQILGVSGAGLTSLAGQTGNAQTFASGSAGTAPAISSASDIHTLNVPLASGAGVTSGTISKTEYDAFNSKLGTSTSFVGDVSGAYNNTSVDKIKGKAVAAVPSLAGQVLRYDGTDLVPAHLSMFDLRSTVTGTATFAAGCLANQTLTWTVATDNLACTDIAGVAAANITNTPAGNIAATTVQAAINELDTEKVAKNGDTMTGTLNLPANGLTVGGSQLVAVSGKIGIGTTSAGVSLDLKNNTDAIALPSGTTAQRPGSPVNGYTRYNTDMKGVEAYVNGGWQQIASGVSPTASEDGMSLRWNETAKQFQWFTAGAAGGGIATLNGLTNSSQNFAIGTGWASPHFDSATSTHTLHIPMAATVGVTAGLISKTEFDAFNSKLGTATSFVGDVSGPYTATSVDKIKGKAVTTPTTSGQMLVYDGTGITPVVMSGDASMLASGAVTLKNTGSVGTYVKVTTDAQGRVVSGATGLGTTEIPDLPWSKITSGTPTTLAGYGITDGVRSVSAGAGLTGGSITSSGTIALSAATQNGLWTGDGTNVWRAGGSVGIGTNNPAVTLDLGNRKDAIALPSGTTAERPVAPVNGFTRYNTDMKGVEAYVNGGWQQITSGITPTASEDGMSLRWNDAAKQFQWFTAGASGGGIGTLNGLTNASQSFAIGTGWAAPHFDSAASTHTLHIPMANTNAVTAGLISKTEFDSFDSKLGTATTFAGDVSGAYNNTSVDKIKGKTVTAAPTLDGQVLRYDGTNLVPAFLSMFDLRSTLTGSSAFGGVGCLNNQTLTWTAATDDLACANIVLPAGQISGVLPVANGGTGTNSLPATFVLNGGQNGAVAVGANDANALNLKAGGVARITVLTGGNVGIGTNSPSTKLDVAGGVKLGNENLCNGTTEGTQRYNSTSKVMEFCNGSGWVEMGGGGGIPSGTVAFFELASCPTGWTAYTTARGRVIVATGTLGADTYNGGDTGGVASQTLGVANLPSHNHTVDPPSTATSADAGHSHGVGTLSGSAASAGAHTHTVSGSTSTDGAHTHSFTDNFAGQTPGNLAGSTGWAPLNSSGADTTASAGNHSHTVTGSAASAGAHTHTVSLSGSTASAGGHSHTVDITSFNSGSTGSGSAFENRQPYLALLACKKN